LARTIALSVEGLSKLGADTLAQLILDEAAGNATFRRRVNAALAVTKGPGPVAGIVDRRLKALEGAKGWIAPEKERDVAADLRGMLDIVVKDLAVLDAAGAVQRLLRFIGTFDSVLNRVQGNGARIDEVYEAAADAVPALVEKLPAAERGVLPGWIGTLVRDADRGFGQRIGAAVAPLLSDAELAAWDRDLATCKESPGVLALRQAIAAARQLPDDFVALEARKPDWRQRPVRVAEVLAAAGRFEEALVWVRKTRPPGTMLVVTKEELESGRIGGRGEVERARVESGILDAMKDRAAAQALRWSVFVRTLDAGTLRDYLAKLDDFTEQDELEKAFDVAEAYRPLNAALQFLIGWPRLDRAARLVMAHARQWDGAAYEILAEAAASLEEKHPLAAAVLYRALIEDILRRARQTAYGHGSRYLKHLDGLARRIDDWAGLEDHAVYLKGLRALHGKKSAFWELAKA
jgi:hypothetical protein